MCTEWFWYLHAISKNKSFNFIVFLEEFTITEGSTRCWNLRSPITWLWNQKKLKFSFVYVESKHTSPHRATETWWYMQIILNSLNFILYDKYLLYFFLYLFFKTDSGRHTLGWLHDSHLRPFIPLCNPLIFIMGKACDRF